MPRRGRRDVGGWKEGVSPWACSQPPRHQPASTNFWKRLPLLWLTRRRCVGTPHARPRLSVCPGMPRAALQAPCCKAGAQFSGLLLTTARPLLSASLSVFIYRMGITVTETG